MNKKIIVNLLMSQKFRWLSIKRKPMYLVQDSLPLHA